MMTKEIIIRLAIMLEKYQQLFSEEEREAIKTAIDMAQHKLDVEDDRR